MNFEYYSVDERVQMLKWHYSGKNMGEIAKLFAENFTDRKIPTAKLIQKMLRVFEACGCVNNCPGPGRCKKSDNYLCVEWEESVCKELDKNPELEVEEIVQKLNNKLSENIVEKILTKNGYERRDGVWIKQEINSETEIKTEELDVKFEVMEALDLENELKEIGETTQLQIKQECDDEIKPQLENGMIVERIDLPFEVEQIG